MANKNATAHVNKTGDSVGESEVCNMWHDYFQNLYNSIQDNGSRKNVFDKCYLLQDSFINDCVTVKEVTDAIMGQKKSKAQMDLRWRPLYTVELRYGFI